MSALGKEIGVECAKCRRKGHHCQAQMVQEQLSDVSGQWSEEPVCMRCADGEPCCYETAAKLATPERMREETDPCAVPPVTDEDRELLARIEAAERKASIDKLPLRAAIYGDLGKMTKVQVAEKYHLSISQVKGYYSHRLQMAEYSKAKASAPVEQWIGGEMVVMAPMASMGAEILEKKESEASLWATQLGLGASGQESGKPEKRWTMPKVLEAVAGYYGVNKSEMMHQKGKQGRLHVARNVAIYFARELAHASFPCLATEFGMHHTTCMHACNLVSGWFARGGERARELDKLYELLI